MPQVGQRLSRRLVTSPDSPPLADESSTSPARSPARAHGSEAGRPRSLPTGELRRLATCPTRPLPGAGTIPARSASPSSSRSYTSNGARGSRSSPQPTSSARGSPIRPRSPTPAPGSPRCSGRAPAGGGRSATPPRRPARPRPAVQDSSASRCGRSRTIFAVRPAPPIRRPRGSTRSPPRPSRPGARGWPGAATPHRSSPVSRSPAPPSPAPAPRRSRTAPGTATRSSAASGVPALLQRRQRLPRRGPHQARPPVERGHEHQVAQDQSRTQHVDGPAVEWPSTPRRPGTRSRA